MLPKRVTFSDIVIQHNIEQDEDEINENFNNTLDRARAALESLRQQLLQMEDDELNNSDESTLSGK